MAKVTRLLEQIIPEHYRLKLDVDMEKFCFRGSETITFELKRPSHELVFHAVGLDITRIDLDEDAAAKVTGTALSEADQTVTITFQEEIPAGKHQLGLEYTGEIQDSLHGFYRSHYERDGQERWIATTQFEPASAREALVCVDEPAAKAVFELSLVVPEALTAISNTAVAGEEPAQAAGRKQVNFAPTPRMSSYLLAFLVGEFEYVEGHTPEGVTVRAYATPGLTSQLGFALEAGVRCLSFYDNYFGIPYPLPKLDMIAVPDFAAGAMENWGAVTYRDTALLLDPAKTSLGNKQRVAEVVAHELAHQWFGDLVTMAWWDDLWLNEGFATWVASLAMNQLWPDWEIWTQFIQEEFAQGQDLDSLANTHPIQVEVDDPRALDEIFDAISYAKGASILNMLHHYLGAEDFKQGLHDYLTKHKYGNTVTHDLWSALGKASGKPVDAMMSAWTARPGYPLVSFEDGWLSQRRFYSSPREAAKAAEAKFEPWPVPFSVLTAEGRETAAELVKTTSAELPTAVVAADWFKPNPGQTAFYRSHYTEGMIGALTAPMRAKALPATDRFGVVSDVFATTEAGVADSTVALKLVEAMREETDYVVWGAVSGGFGSLGAVVEDEALRQRLDRFGHWLVQPNVKRLGWEPRSGESSFDTLMRPVVLQQAVRFDDQTVTKMAQKHFEEYLSGRALDPDLRPVALYAAARHGDAGEFDAMLERYRTEGSPQVKMSLLGALGRFRKPDLMKRYLALGLSPDVRPQDLYIVLAWGLRNREGRDQAWSWVKSNWDLFIERYGAGGHMVERFPLYAAMGFATREMAAEIKDFFESHPHPATKRPTAQAVESVELKADWYERDRAKIEAFLSQWEAKNSPSSK